MLKNYLKIIWRTIYRRPVYTFLNVSCLTIGIASALLVLLYLDFELNFDRFHRQGDLIYRVETKAIKTRQKVINVDWQGTPANLGPYIQQDYPQVKSFVRFYNFFTNEGLRFEYDGKIVKEEDIYAVDSSALNVFSLNLIKGDPQTALRGPNKLIISEDLAARIFGDRDPIGKLVETSLVHQATNLENDYAFEVTGVYRNFPRNTHLYAHALISAETDSQLNEYYFNQFHVYTYLLLNSGADPNAFASQLAQVYDKYLDSEREPVLLHAEHELIPLTKIHFNATGGRTYVYIFSGVGLLLLLIAFISYVNMVTAQGSKRALEIGVRKVLGSRRKQLIFQFLSESLLYTLIALGAALILITTFIDPINVLLDLHIATEQLWRPRLLAGMLGIAVLLGLIGGSYPAFFLSSFQPIAVMKGKLTNSAPLRKFLLAFQFAVVLFVLAGAGMIYQQLQYLRNKDLGFNREHLIQLALSGQEDIGKLPVLKEVLKSRAEVLSVASSSFTPGIGGMIRGPVSVSASEPDFVRRGFVDYDYLRLMDVDLVAGRNFLLDFPADSTQSIIVNESFVRNFDIGDDPIGKTVKLGDWRNPNSLQIIGVIEDFHQNSLHNAIEPQLFRLSPASDQLVVKIGPDLRAGIARVEQTWAEVFPDKLFEYHFFDDLLQERYQADQRRGKIFFFFSFLTIFLAFVGLFGLAAYLAGQRIKEVGIRRVFGAGLWDVVLLLSKDFLRLVTLAAIPGLILARYVISRWLDNFAYQTEMNYYLFGLVFVLVLLLTFVTVGWHAIRAARLNPKDALKYE